MRLIQQDKHNANTLEVVWMWLPTFIGQNTHVLGELDHALAARFPTPLEIGPEKLDEIHGYVIDYLCEKFNIPGLRQYLEAVSLVDQNTADLNLAVYRMIKDLFKPGVDWEAVERGEEVTDNRLGIKIQKVGDPVKGVQKGE
jgi:hypothetical protein